MKKKFGSQEEMWGWGRKKNEKMKNLETCKSVIKSVTNFCHKMSPTFSRVVSRMMSKLMQS